MLFLSAAILVAHLKLSTSELRQILMNMTTDRLEPAHIKQLLLYAPNDDEVKQYEQFEQDPAKLSEPDQFIFQVKEGERRERPEGGGAPPRQADGCLARFRC